MVDQERERECRMRIKPGPNVHTNNEIKHLNVFPVFSHMSFLRMHHDSHSLLIMIFSFQISGLRLSRHPCVDRKLEPAGNRFRRLAPTHRDVTGRMPDFSGRNLDRMSRKTDRSNSHHFAARFSLSTTCQVSYLTF